MLSESPRDSDSESNELNALSNEEVCGLDEDPWVNYQLRRCCFWMVVLLGPIVAFAASHMPETFQLLVFWVIYPLLFVLVARWFRSFICPRCGQYFFRGGNITFAGRRFSYHNYLTDECIHCGLPKWAGIEKGTGEEKEKKSDGVGKEDERWTS